MPHESPFQLIPTAIPREGTFQLIPTVKKDKGERGTRRFKEGAHLLPEEIKGQSIDDAFNNLSSAQGSDQPPQGEPVPQTDPFAFLNNSTTQALLGTASAAMVGPGFLSEALAAAPSAPQLIGKALEKLSIGNTLADAFGAGKRVFQELQKSQGSPPQQAQPQQSSDGQSTDEEKIIAIVNGLNSEEVSKAMFMIQQKGGASPELVEALRNRMQFLREQEQ